MKDLKDMLGKQTVASLAAPQIGVQKQGALLCFGQDDGQIQPPIVIISPEILEAEPPMKDSRRFNL